MKIRIIRSILIFLIDKVAYHLRQAILTIDSLRSYFSSTSPSNLSPKQSPFPSPNGGGQEGASSNLSTLNSNLSLLSTKRIFLNQHITVEEAASQMGISRSELTTAIFEQYNCTFREYINSLRIEYAKEYYKSHPDIKQELLAEACGFPDAPSFNKKFKQLVGTTPRMWLAMVG